MEDHLRNWFEPRAGARATPHNIPYVIDCDRRSASDDLSSFGDAPIDELTGAAIAQRCIVVKSTSSHVPP